MLSVQEYLAAKLHYYQVIRKEQPGMRFGQHFVNSYGWKDLELFYEDHDAVAESIILERHVDWAEAQKER